MTMQEQKLKYRQVRSPCAVCGKEGIESQIERLPKGGILYRAIHEEDGTETEHRWAEYTSITVGRERRERNEDKTKIKCPKILEKGPRKGQVCNRLGRINSFHRDIDKHPEEISYQVVHGKLSVRKHGTWGKEKQPKRDRCYIDVPEQRNMILKKLGYYIEQK
jgi:hypothetical protein